MTASCLASLLSCDTFSPSCLLFYNYFQTKTDPGDKITKCKFQERDAIKKY